ncbi:ATP-dependent RNA helicase ded1, partial [Chrysochromulina tobinii]
MKGRGGGGRGGTGADRGAPPGRGRGGGVGAPLGRQDRKESKWSKQQAAEAARDRSEDEYFKQCQAQALRSGEAKKAAAGLTGQEADAHEKALFAQQGSQGIQFDKYADIKVETSGPGADVAAPFSDFGSLTLPSFLLRNISLMNYSKPTPIQRHAVPLALAGCDLMCCAQTGSGKTAAFLIPVCSSLSSPAAGGTTVGQPGAAKPRAVIMAPTRELASQIGLEAQKLTNRSPLRSVAVYGGADQRKQARELALGVDLIVATPGRLNDFIRRIVRTMPAAAERHTLLFSATFPAPIQQLAKEFLRPYVWIGVGRVGSTVEGIEQRVWLATADKRAKLALVVKALADRSGRSLVFVEKKRTATWLKKTLRHGGPAEGGEEERFEPIAAEDIHGDRSQSQREAALAAFRSGSCRVLVATDVAARGLDVPGVEHVINMDLPFAREDFDSV